MNALITVTIHLDDPDLVEAIADANDVGVVTFEGMVACVVPWPAAGVVAKYVAVDAEHELAGVA